MREVCPGDLRALPPPPRSRRACPTAARTRTWRAAPRPAPPRSASAPRGQQQHDAGTDLQAARHHAGLARANARMARSTSASAANPKIRYAIAPQRPAGRVARSRRRAPAPLALRTPGQERLAAAGGVDRDRRQQVAQLPRRAAIEAAVGAPGQPRDLAEGARRVGSSPSWNRNTGTPSSASSPARAHSRSTSSSMQSPT